MNSEKLTTFSIGGLALAGFVVLSVWLVRSEGERYRQSRRQGNGHAAVPAEVPESNSSNTLPGAAAGKDASERLPSGAGPDRAPRRSAETADSPAALPTTTDEGTGDDFELDEHTVFPGLSQPSGSRQK
jgi:hypothetical protein